MIRITLVALVPLLSSGGLGFTVVAETEARVNRIYFNDFSKGSGLITKLHCLTRFLKPYLSSILNK